MCDISIFNPKGHPFIFEIRDRLESQFKVSPCKRCTNSTVCIADVDEILPHKLIKSLASIHYIVALTDSYANKDVVKYLYKLGFADVRPKNAVDFLEVSIKKVLSRKRRT